MAYTYGRSPSDYVEVPVLDAQGQSTGQVQRPAAGVPVLVRDADTDAALPSTLTKAYGYLDFTATPPVVEVSADGGVTWKTLFGVEGLGSAVTIGQNPKVLKAPAVAPSTTQVVTITTAGVMGTTPLSTLAGSTTGGTAGLVSYPSQAAADAAAQSGAIADGQTVIVLAP